MTGKQLKERRDELGVTRKVIAAIAGKNLGTWINWESKFPNKQIRPTHYAGIERAFEMLEKNKHKIERLNRIYKESKKPESIKLKNYLQELSDPKKRPVYDQVISDLLLVLGNMDDLDRSELKRAKLDLTELISAIDDELFKRAWY